MTVWEYAIAREASRLMREQEKRELTREEAKLLHLLAPTLERYQREEEARRMDQRVQRARIGGATR